MHTRLSLNIPKRNITTFLSLRKQLTNANQYKVIEGITAKKNLNEPIQNSKSKPKKVSSRILGIAHSPKLEETQPKRLGWIERFKNIFDAEKNRENREKLLKEYNTPYWKDFDELRKEGGKLWEAETELVNAQKALYMPNIKARSLSKSAIDTTDLLEGHTTLVAIFFNQFGENHTQTFIKPFLDEFSDHDKIQLMK
ncbi:16409_t:CDS:2, partial [Acaulospora morrowiae]